MRNNQTEITQQDIFRARSRIGSLIRPTLLVDCGWLSQKTGANVRLKLENLQNTGSFKLRGAANKLMSLSEGERERGVITVSTGNHGRAVAYAAGKLGLRGVICVSEMVPQNKLDAIRRLGAQVMRFGDSYDEAEEQAARLQAERNLTFVDPFDDPFVIAGQGTIGLELLDEMPEIDTADFFCFSKERAKKIM